MGYANTVLCLATVALAGTQAGKLPPDIKRCARTNPKLFECLRDAVEDTLPKLKNGLPKAGLQAPLDPLFVKELRISQGGQGPISADLVFTDLVTTGLLDDDKVYKTEIDFNNMTIDANFLFSRAIATSNYTVKGRVLVLPIYGFGGSKIVLSNCTCTWRITGQRITKKDGKQYMNITNVLLDMVPQKMEIQLDNLFNGDDRLGKTMNRVLNENWQLVYNEIGPSFEEAYAKVIEHHSRSLFLHVPLDELFPEKL